MPDAGPSGSKAPAGITYPVHHDLILKNGIPHQDAMHLTELAAVLAAARRRLFAYIDVAVPVKRASGSSGVSLAVLECCPDTT